MRYRPVMSRRQKTHSQQIRMNLFFFLFFKKPTGNILKMFRSSIFNLYGKGVDAPVRRIPRSSDHLVTTHPLERHSSQTKKSLNILTSSRPRTKNKVHLESNTHLPGWQQQQQRNNPKMSFPF
jgi:hypothetical protein